MSILDITVVIPLYNNEKEISRAVESVLAQEFKPVSIIIVNDGSTDESPEMAAKYSDSRIQIIHQNNRGVSAARNAGIRSATSKYVAFLDADDEWMPQFLSEIHSLWKTFPSEAMYATRYIYQEQNGRRRLPIIALPVEWKGIIPDYFAVAAYSDPPVWSSAVVIRKDLLDAIGGFPEDIRVGEDLLTWAKIAAKHQVVYSMATQAVFYLRAPIAGKPSRSPEIPDRVGLELSKLLPMFHDQKNRRTFRHYCAMWHRMRAAMFLQRLNRKQGFKEILTIARYHPISPQLYFYIGLFILPKFIEIQIMSLINLYKTSRRRTLHNV